MKRFIYSTLNNWLAGENNFLIIDGAPMVGKTSMIKEFLSENSESYSYIDLHVEDDLNLSQISDGIIIVDHLDGDKTRLKEVFEISKERPAAKFVVIDSFIKVGRGEISIGRVNYLTLEPLSFEEFLYNTDQNLYKELTSVNDIFSLSEHLHTTMMERFMDYLIVGGIPSVVSIYINDGLNFDKIREHQQDIVKLTEKRLFNYYNRTYVKNFFKIISLIVTSLKRDNKKFRVSDISTSTRFSSFKKYIDTLIALNIVSQSSLVSDNSLLDDDKKSILYFFDTGLLGCISSISDVFYQTKEPLTDPTTLSLVLNTISMQIKNSHRRVKHHHWLRNMSKIEFLLVKDDKIIPIEIKDDSSGKLKSFDTINDEFDNLPLLRINTLPPAKKGDITTYPVYLINSVLRKYLS